MPLHLDTPIHQTGKRQPATPNRQPEECSAADIESTASDAEWRAHLEDRIDRLENLLQQLVDQNTVKDWYGTEEVAERLGKADFTVREWCRLGRIRAEAVAWAPFIQMGVPPWKDFPPFFGYRGLFCSVYYYVALKPGHSFELGTRRPTTTRSCFPPQCPISREALTVPISAPTGPAQGLEGAS